MYNIENEEYREYVKGLCISGLPIPFYNKFLYHITVEDMFKIGESKYYKLIYAFRLDSEIISGNHKSLLDLLSNRVELNLYFDLAIEFLKVVFATEDIKVKDFPNDDLNGTHTEIIIDEILADDDKALYINDDKFQELADILLIMCYSKKIKKEEIESTPKEKRLTYEQIMSIKNSREREYQLAIYNNNKKEDEKNSKMISLYGIYNYLSHFLGFLNYEKILKLNLYQFYNSFEKLQIIEKYNSDMSVLSSGMCSDTKKIDNRFLNQRIMDK